MLINSWRAILYDVLLYRRLIALQIRAQLQYKINIFVDITTYLAVTALEFGVLLLYFGPFPSLLGWNIGEVALLTAIMSIGFGLAELAGAGIGYFSDKNKGGQFDRLLLRPVG